MKFVLKPMTHEYLDYRSQVRTATNFVQIMKPVDSLHLAPVAMIALDALYDSADPYIYGALNDGETVTVELSIVEA